MGRRSAHSAGELRRLIIDACKSIIVQEGITGLTARKIASSIGYSAGTLYNVFENLDDLLLTVQIEIVNDVCERLKAVTMGPDAIANIDALTEVYIGYAVEHARLWNLIFAHTLPAGARTPQELHDGINCIAATVYTAIAPSAPHAPADKINLAARALWAGVHGITAIAVSEKGPSMTQSSALNFARALTGTFMAGFKAQLATV